MADSTPTVAIVDPLSSGKFLAKEFLERGWRSVAVLSRRELPRFFLPSYHPDDFAAVINEGGDLEATVAALRPHAPQALTVGTEIGVELVDALAERCGHPGNGTALSSARRDKIRMADVLAGAGILVPRTQSMATADEVVRWAHEHSLWPIVIKPCRSAGSDSVFFCDSPQQVKAAVAQIVGHENKMGELNDSVCAQELVTGDQYIVNTVSAHGRHRVCEIWRDARRPIEGNSLAYDVLDLVPLDGPEQAALVECTRRSLDALGIRFGAAHAELMMTDRGPLVIEIAARMMGSMSAEPTFQTLGYNQVTLTVDATIDPDSFAQTCDRPYELRRIFRIVPLIVPYDATIADASLLGAETFPSLYALTSPVHTGQAVQRTIDVYTTPAALILLADTHEEIERDYARLRSLESDGLYRRAQ